MATLKNTYILLGCSNTSEMDNRISLLYGICKYENNYLIVLTGTEKEVLYMYERLQSLTTNILFEYNSRSTIDNIVNTFYYLFNAKRPFITVDDETKEIIDYGKLHIVSSEYHLERVQFICSNLKITKKLDIHYLGSITTDFNILQKRRDIEKWYGARKELFLKQIHRIEKIQS